MVLKMILIMSKRKLAMKILNFVLILAVLTVGLSLIMGLKGAYGAESPIPSFAMEPNSINFEDKNPQVYAPEFSDEYEFDIEILNHFSEELYKRFNEEPRRTKLLFVYIENNTATRLSKFVSWVISKKSQISETLKKSKEGRYCVYYFGYAPELSYVLIGWEEGEEGACSDYSKITSDFFNQNPVSFLDVSTPLGRDKAKRWLSALAEEVMFRKKEQDEKTETDFEEETETEFEEETETDIGEENEIDVEEVPRVGAPHKNPSAYLKKGLFLISNEDWRNVLSLVPVSTWETSKDENSDAVWCKKGYGTPSDICVYPTMIYHKEENKIDTDSIVYFIRAYKPEKVDLITSYREEPEFSEMGNILVSKNGAGLKKDMIEIVKPFDYIKYWNSYDKVVYCKDDYSIALFASVYASHINSPFIVEHSSLDKEAYLDGREVICVGEVDKKELCSKTYSLNEIEAEFCKETSCSKQIFVNPNDFYDYKTDELETEFSSYKITHLFQKNSLISPFLASAKKEIIRILELDSSGKYYPSNIDSEIKEKFFEESGFEKPYYSSCTLGEPCSKGFKEFKHEFWFSKDSFRVNLPQELINRELSSASIELQGAFMECNSPVVKATADINGERIWESEIPCFESLSFLEANDFVVSDYRLKIKIRLPPLITSDKLNINFDGASLFFYDAEEDPRKSFYSLEGTPKQGKKIKFYCDKNNMNECFNPTGKKEVAYRGTSVEQMKKTPVEFVLESKEGSSVYFGLNFKAPNYYMFSKEKFTLKTDLEEEILERCVPVFKLNNIPFEIHPRGSKTRIIVEPCSSYNADTPFTLSVGTTEVEGDLSNGFYMTIIGPNKFISEAIPHPDYSVYTATDPNIYAKFFGRSLFPNIAIGRIKGFTTSDVSSMVMRTLFYTDVLGNYKKAVLMTTADPEGSWAYIFDKRKAVEFGNALSKSGINIEIESKDKETYDFEPELWKDKQFIFYLNHGLPDWAGIDSDEIPILDSSIVSLIACLTCSSEDADSFCYNAIRKGAVSVIGTVSRAYTGFYTPFSTLEDMLSNQYSIGESFKMNYHYNALQNMYELIGDPTFTLPFKITIKKEVFS